MQLIYSDKKKNPVIHQFLVEQQTKWNKIDFLSLKAFFPEFLTEPDKIDIKSTPQLSSPWEVPNNRFPESLSLSDDVSLKQLHSAHFGHKRHKNVD